MTSWAELLTCAEPGEHLVQLYGEDDRLLARNVSRYLAAGLRRGDGLVVVATPEHTSAIARHLVDEDATATGSAARTGRLRYLDAGATLASLLVDGRLDEARFRAFTADVLGAVRARSETGTVRAFGEMVSLLREAGKPEEAGRLEALWNDILLGHGCSLYCAYRLDLFDPRVGARDLQPIMCTHDHLLAGTGTLISSGRSRA